MSKTKTRRAVEVDRRQVLAFRARQQGLAREEDDVTNLRVLDLGLQDTPAGSARLAIAARLDVRARALAAGGRRDPLADERLVMVWTVRGAPHLHRVADLPRFTEGLWPSSDADASAKLVWNASRVEESGLAPAEAVRVAAEAVAQVAGTTWPRGRITDKRPPITKGVLSAEVTKLVPDGLKRFCEGCGSVHVHEQLLRLAALPGGLALDTGATPVTFRPLADPPGVPDRPGDPEDLVLRVLGLHGPASMGDVAGTLGTSRAALKPHWPVEGLTEVEVDGVKGPVWMREDLLDELVEAEEVTDVRLLPPGDPMLQGRDRELLVPDPALRKAVWRPLGSPGTLWSEGEVIGTWRPKAGPKKLTLTVETARPLAASERDGIEEEAHRVAEARGLAESAVKLV